MLTLYIDHMRSLLELGSCVWNLEYISNMKVLEDLQRRWTKRIDVFEDLDLFSVEGRF